MSSFFCLNDTATTEIYTYRHPLSLPDALPIAPDNAPTVVLHLQDGALAQAQRIAHRLGQGDLAALGDGRFHRRFLLSMKYGWSLHTSKIILNPAYCRNSQPLRPPARVPRPSHRSVRPMSDSFATRARLRSEEHTSEPQSLMRLP